MEMEIDKGLVLLLPLYDFQENALSELAYDFFVKGFRDTDFIKKIFPQNPGNTSISNQSVQEPPKSTVTNHTTLFELLHRINDIYKKEVDQRKNKNGKGKKNSVPQMDMGKNKRLSEIYNIDENEMYLKEVTVQKLLAPDNLKICEPLKNLHHQFLLNLILNKYLWYDIKSEVVIALNDLKDVRNNLSHPRLNFSKEDYDKEFEKLAEATSLLYDYLGYDHQDLEKKKDKCQKLAEHAEKESKVIFDELRNEIHSVYKPPDPEKWPILPNMSLLSPKKSEEQVEDLSYFMEVKEVKPILLCGARGAGKSLILEKLSCTLKEKMMDSLILYLHDGHCKDLKDKDEFWKKIFRCVKVLVPGIVNRYGLDIVQTVLRVHMERVVFLVDWGLTVVGSLCTEMQKGRWVISFQNFHSPSEDWYVLNVKPYQAHVLHRFDNKLTNCYKSSGFNDLLTSPAMIALFLDLKKRGIQCDSVFEIMQKEMGLYKEEDLIDLGKIAFKNKSKPGSLYSEKELNRVESEMRKSFLYQIQQGRYKFNYPAVEDFLIAKFIVDDIKQPEKKCKKDDLEKPKKICKEWLRNAKDFQLVFVFACALWCQNKDDMLRNKHHIESYLSNLYNREKINKSEKKEECKKVKQKEERSFVNPYRDAFTDWSYLLQVDDVCHGFKECTQVFADILSTFQCWILRPDVLDDDEGRLTRVVKILSKVKAETQVCIKLEDNGNVSMLLNAWNKLKNIENLQQSEVIIRLKTEDDPKDYIPKSYEDLYDAIAKSYRPLSIKEISGPFFCSRTPDFYKCSCVKKLERILVSVHDIVSFKEVLALDNLCSVKNIKVNLDVERDQSQSNYLELNMPENAQFQLTIKYFEGLQELLNTFKYPHHLQALSIHNVYVTSKFELNISRFENLKSFYVRCEPSSSQANESKAEDMETGLLVDNNLCRYDRSQWMMPLLMKITLPKKLKRLMYRNVDFYNDSNNFLQAFIKIDRLMLLDSRLTLKGVRKVVSSHSKMPDDDIVSKTKELKVGKAEVDIVKKVSKQPRYSEETRQELRKTKPSGKELIITSTLGLCMTCCKFPCHCKQLYEMDRKESLEDLVYLIEDIYNYQYLNFSYTSDIFTLKKDVCGDLMVRCSLTELEDNTLMHLEPSDWLARLFHVLILAQIIIFERTKLSYRGVRSLIELLRNSKVEASTNGNSDPFSLTISSTYHPTPEDNGCFNSFMQFLDDEKLLSTFRMRCTCKDRCYYIRKIYKGQIFYNNKPIDLCPPGK